MHYAWTYLTVERRGGKLRSNLGDMFATSSEMFAGLAHMWELVSVIGAPDGDCDFYFKRPRA